MVQSRNWAKYDQYLFDISLPGRRSVEEVAREEEEVSSEGLIEPVIGGDGESPPGDGEPIVTPDQDPETFVTMANMDE